MEENQSELSSRSSRRAQLRSDAPEGAAVVEAPKRKRWIFITAIIAVVAVIGSVGAGLYFTGFFGTADDYAGGGSGEVLFVISEGDIGENIAQNLVDDGVTKSFDAFYNLLLEQPDIVFVHGTYRLKEKMSAQAALDALLDPANRVELSVTIPEGKTLKQTLQLLAQDLGIPLADFEAAVATPSNYGVPVEATTLEGFLFPATYNYSPGVTATEVITRMVNETLGVLDEVGTPLEKRWEVIVLASVVQMEMGPDPEDAGKIAQVFYNRLEQGMVLGSDVTTCYGANLEGEDCLLITNKALKDSSNLYNTRENPGLPIGPISSPGFVAIDAVQNPPQGSLLYFCVVNPDTGETVFSETYAEHQVADAQLQKWLVDNGYGD